MYFSREAADAETGAISRETTRVAAAAMRVALVEATRAVAAAATATTNRAKILETDAAMRVDVAMRVLAAAIRAMTRTPRVKEAAVVDGMAAPWSTG